jgi:hypothetical protein
MKYGVSMSGLRARLQMITKVYGVPLLDAVLLREPDSQEVRLSPPNLVVKFADADPTSGKARTQWMVKTYIGDAQFRLEDLDRMNSALRAFERFKQRLPIEQRELSHLSTLSALETLVEPFVKQEEQAKLARDLSSVTGREKRRLEAQKAREESIVIQEAEGLATIAVPMTPFAAQWWGRGTKWCTTSANGHTFLNYHIEAPLIILVDTDGAKFQMYVTPKSFQFMDARDKRVSLDDVEARWVSMRAMLEWAIKHRSVLYNLPEGKRTKELCRIALEQNSSVRSAIPNSVCDDDLYSLVVVQNILMLETIYLADVPDNIRTEALYARAFKQDAYALEFFPDHMIDEALCRQAVERNGCTLQHVPEQYITELLCLLAVTENSRAVQYVPERLQTEQLLGIAVRDNGLTLSDIPLSMRTENVCRMAVQQNGQILEYVPDHLRKEEICAIAVQNYGTALQWVPPKLRTQKLCLSAIEQNGFALEHTPEELHTEDLYRAVIEQNKQEWTAIPEHRLTDELCRLIVEKDTNALMHMSEDKITTELCRIAFHHHGWICYPDIPLLFRTPDMCRDTCGQESHPVMEPKWHPDILAGLSSTREFVSNVSATILGN